jgi:hypothetical protein
MRHKSPFTAKRSGEIAGGCFYLLEVDGRLVLDLDVRDSIIAVLRGILASF